MQKRRLYCFSFRDFEKRMIDLGYKKDDQEKLCKDNISVISIGCTDDVAKYSKKTYEYHYFNVINPIFGNVLNVKFDDVDPLTWNKDIDYDTAVNNDFIHKDEATGITVHALDWDTAKTICEFIDLQVLAERDIFVHCSAGKSRSQGVVKYILDQYHDIDWQLNLNNPCITPNYHVVSMLKRSYNKL